MRKYLTRPMLVLAALSLVILAAGGYCIYLTPPGSRWLAILAFLAGVAGGSALAVYPHRHASPPGRED